jgi:hypothetical protein
MLNGRVGGGHRGSVSGGGMRRRAGTGNGLD